MTRLLRDRDGRHARVEFVELFFAPVFVFAVTQTSHTLLAHLTPLGALQAAMMTAAVWRAWTTPPGSPTDWTRAARHAGGGGL